MTITSVVLMGEARLIGFSGFRDKPEGVLGGLEKAGHWRIELSASSSTGHNVRCLMCEITRQRVSSAHLDASLHAPRILLVR